MDPALNGGVFHGDDDGGWTRAHLLGNADVGLNDTVACARAPRRHPRSIAMSSRALRVRMMGWSRALEVADLAVENFVWRSAPSKFREN